MNSNLRKSLIGLLSFVFLWQAATPLTQISREERDWQRITDERMPPDLVLPAIGVQPGMVIGEVGAGAGRYTLHLATHVGPTGKIYANDIDEKALAQLRARCQREGISNVVTVLGRVDDPLLPKDALDMVIMVWVFHHLDKPVDLLKNLKPSLKPGATVVIIDPDVEREGLKPDSDRPTDKVRVEKEAGEAGFELVRYETFLPKDNIFILRVKASLKRRPVSSRKDDKFALVPASFFGRAR